jgi:ribosome maturation protein SDO1
MNQVVARMKKAGKEFEILVDLDSALAMKKTKKGSIQNVLAVDTIFSNSKKGLHSSYADLTKCFGFSDKMKVAEEIILHGEIQLPAEYRKKEREEKYKRVVDILSRTCIDPKTGLPHTPSRILSALESAGISVIEGKSIEEQIPEIIQKLQPIIPLRYEIKKVMVKIPPVYVAQAYGLLKEYKEKEEWLNDGSLNCVVNIPAALQMEFYDKLNNITHGNSVTQDIK